MQKNRISLLVLFSLCLVAFTACSPKQAEAPAVTTDPVPLATSTEKSEDGGCPYAKEAAKNEGSSCGAKSACSEKSGSCEKKDCNAKSESCGKKDCGSCGSCSGKTEAPKKESSAACKGASCGKSTKAAKSL